MASGYILVICPLANNKNASPAAAGKIRLKKY
jgi:hypothetical protein